MSEEVRSQKRPKPFAVSATATSSPETFLTDYLTLVSDGVAPGVMAEWLFSNAANMREGMFFQPDIDWAELAPHHVLTLRACAPAGVFTSTAKGGYLSRVGGDTELSEVATAAFTNDHECLDNLPASCKTMRPQLVQLMQLAYRKGIRSADSRVKSM